MRRVFSPRAAARAFAAGSMLTITLLPWGCARINTRSADLDSVPDGVRVYPPKVFLLVDAEEDRSTLAILPDYQRAYDVRPVTFLARQEFSIQLADGQLKSLAADQDTTAALALIREGAQTAAKAAGVGTSLQTINGSFGLESGIYVLGEDNVFRRAETP